MVTAAMSQCPNQQIKEPYSGFLSFLLYFHFSFVCSSLIFSNNLQLFIAQWSSFIRGKKKYCATEVIVCEDSLWYTCERIAVSGEDSWVSAPDIPLELLGDLAKKWLFKRKIHKCQRNLWDVYNEVILRKFIRKNPCKF